MISDVLSDAIHAIKEYRRHPGTRDAYSDPKISRKIDRVVKVMDDLRSELDTPPRIASYDRRASTPGVRERQRAKKDLVNALFTQYPNVPKKELGKLVDSAISGVGYKAKELNKRKSASERVARQSGREIFYSIVPERQAVRLYDKLEKEDEQSAQLFLDVIQELQDQLDISPGAESALSRIRNVVDKGSSWDAALIRNNVFKAANSLGMKLPSHMF